MAKFDINKLIAEVEREIQQKKRELLELKQIKAATSSRAAMRQSYKHGGQRIRQTKTQTQTIFRDVKPPSRSVSPLPQRQARQRQHEGDIESRIRAQLEAEFQKKYEALEKSFRQAARQRGAKNIHLKRYKQAILKGGAFKTYGGHVRGRVGDGHRQKPFRERFTPAQKAEARAYHLAQAQAHGFKYVKPLPATAKERANVIWLQKQDVQRMAKANNVNVDRVKYSQGSANSKMMIKHMAKFKSFISNPNTKEKLRGDVWKKVLRGELQLGSKALDRALRETRDIVGDFYGIETL